MWRREASSGPELIQQLSPFVGLCMRYFLNCPEL